MHRITYHFRQLHDKSRDDIDRANHVLTEYAQQGYTLTLRQLYYQFVARGWCENTERTYKRLGSLVSKARLAGYIDWYYLVDRTRNLRHLAHWDSPQEIIAACAEQFRVDHWATQPKRIEVWVEKDALIDVVAKACNPLDVPYFSCRGYTSQSEMWMAAQRFIDYAQDGQETVILHLGDHDPSGMDMSRDIHRRLNMFCGHGVRLERLALNMPQIQEHKPPPNPTKVTDSRAADYIDMYGHECWELDALEPTLLCALVTEAIDRHKDERAFAWAESETAEGRRIIKQLADSNPSYWDSNDVY